MRRGSVPPVFVGLAALLALLVTASPAFADDEYEIDERLADAGFEDALSNYANAESGVRVYIDYLTDSEDRAAYEDEAAEIARIVWEHLALRVLAVDVASLSEVGWLDGDLPPAVSFTRSELEQQHGPRATGLDANESSMWADDTAGLVFAGIAGVVVLLLGGAGGFLLGWLVGRRRRKDAWGSAPAWAGASPPGWGAPSPGQGSWPPADGGPPSSAPPPSGSDPWRPV
jgi:hypothetical protein